jgi:hypothetical protein
VEPGDNDIVVTTMSSGEHRCHNDVVGRRATRGRDRVPGGAQHGPLCKKGFSHKVYG